jgi:hypothetical protein
MSKRQGECKMSLRRRVSHDEFEAMTYRVLNAPPDVPITSTEPIKVAFSSAREFVERARKMYEGNGGVESDYDEYDFMRGEYGETYETRCWKPGREVVPSDDVRRACPSGFYGNAAAFNALMLRDAWAQNISDGRHASIPEDGELFKKGGELYAPAFYHESGYGRFHLDGNVRGRWDSDVCYWFFRRLKKV